jgi:hypothetical protein
MGLVMSRSRLQLRLVLAKGRIIMQALNEALWVFFTLDMRFFDMFSAFDFLQDKERGIVSLCASSRDKQMFWPLEQVK